MTLVHSLADSSVRVTKTILVTGSTDGIGKATAKALVREGHHVLVHGRDREKGRAAVIEIGREAGGTAPQLFTADLSSFGGAWNLVDQVGDSYERLDVLINNAGVYMPSRVLTENGLEMTFAVNLAAPFLLSHLLMPLLEAGAAARIVNVASSAHFDATRLDWDDLQGEKKYDAWGAYAQSKLGVVLFTYALARRLDPGKVTVNCLHPGVICTKLLYAAFPDYPCEPPEAGARTSVHLATSPGVARVTGKYFEGMKEERSSGITHDRDMQDRLWGYLERITGLG